MGIMLFMLNWICLSGWTLVSSLRDGEAPFLFNSTVTRSENAFFYGSCVVFWFLFFGGAIFLLTRLVVHAYLSEPPFQTHGLMPFGAMRWAFAVFNVLLSGFLAYYAWRTMRIHRLLRELEAQGEEESIDSFGRAHRGTSTRFASRDQGGM